MKKLLVPLLCLLLFTGCSSSSSLSKEYLEQYDTGIKYLEEGDYEQAIICFNAAIKIDDKQVQAYTGLYNAYLANGQDEEAQEVLDNIIEKFSEEETDDIDYDDPESLKNKVITGTDENGYPYTYIYDDEGRLYKEIKIWEPEEGGETATQTNTYYYDDNGNLERIEGINTTHDDKGFGNSIEYFENNLVVKQINYFANGIVGTKDYYYEDGKRIYCKEINSDESYILWYYSSNGPIERRENYNADGKLVAIGYYVNGEYDHSEYFD